MRLIDADALREYHCEGCSVEVIKSCKTDPICATLIWVDEAPTIEAEPVKHGKWKRSGALLECQCCGEIYSQLGGNAGKAWNYCPNCGAKMDLEE